MTRPLICAALTTADLAAARSVAALADLFELRLDLIGAGWPQLAGQLDFPWIACNRRAEEGGGWRGSEPARIAELLRAVELGPVMVDIELESPGLPDVVKVIKSKAKCLVSFHDLEETPPLDEMRRIVERQLNAGADVCKLVTTARGLEDNTAVLQLVRDFSEAGIIAFAMGPLGYLSRVLCPLAGGEFTYASIAAGRESAPGQVTVAELRQVYGMLGYE